MIGLGLRGNLVQAAHRPERGSVIAALCDLDLGRAAAWARHAPDAWMTDDYRRVIAAEDIDAVIVATQIGRAHV